MKMPESFVISLQIQTCAVGEMSMESEHVRKLCEHNYCLDYNKIFPVNDQLKYPQPGRYVRHEQVVQIGTLNRFPTKDWIDIEGSIVEVMKELRGRY